MSWVKKDDNLHYEKFQDGTVKCIEDEIPFEVPERWEWARVSFLSAIVTDGEHKTPKRCNNYEGYYLLSARNIQDGYIVLDNVDYVDQEEFLKISKRCYPKRNDILISCSGSIGRVTAISDDNYYVMVRSVAMVRFIEIIPLFAMFALQSPYLQSQMQKYSKQTAQANLFQAAISNLLMPVPPLIEQSNIVKQLYELLERNKLIENNIVEIGNLISKIKSKILDLAIHGQLVPQNQNDEPASVLLERIRAEKEELIKQGKIKRDKNESIIYKGDDNSYYQTDRKTPIDTPYGIPDNWAWSNLKELCNYGECESISPDKISDSAWVLDLEDIEKNTGKVLQRITNAERKTASTKHAFSKNMILYSKLRPYLNKVALADSDGYCTSEILPLNFSTIIHPGYAQLFLMSPFFVKYANHCSYGLKMPRLGTHDGQIALFAVPPYQEQLKIVDMVEQILSRASIIEDSLD